MFDALCFVHRLDVVTLDVMAAIQFIQEIHPCRLVHASMQARSSNLTHLQPPSSTRTLFKIFRLTT